MSIRHLAWLVLLGGGCAAVRQAPLMTVAGVDPMSVEPPPTVQVAEAPAPSVPSDVPSAPTWTAIYTAYFGPGSPGACGRSSECHAAVMGAPPSAYKWLTERGYIDGTRSALVSRTNSCLKWFGGNMPPRGEPSDGATRDLSAWVAAGAPEN